jgi:SAM-dependent methyltransferase
MKLIDVVQRQAVPVPWSEGEKIPWNDPDFSQRMLQEHLSQAHDMASRRSEIIDQHVAWIQDKLLSGQPARILDLGCGPGLYASRLARLGHECMGIDFSPASIAYARQQAQAEKLRCTYTQQDVRTADFGSGYRLVTFIFGEFNVFNPADTRHILEKAYQALAVGGSLLLEAHTYAAVRKIGEGAPSWYSSPSGLFSDRPHLCLTENIWDAESAVATIRHFIVDAATGEVTRHAASMQAYTTEQYRSLLEGAGFAEVTFYPGWNGDLEQMQDDWLVVIVARKPLS